MSSRAIRALRGETASIISDVVVPSIVVEGDDNDDDSDEQLGERRRMAPVSFSILNDDSDDDSNDTSDDQPNDNVDSDEPVAEKISIRTKKENEKLREVTTINEEDNVDRIEEDLDALLTEFEEKDYSQQLISSVDQSSTQHDGSSFDFILKHLDLRDLDYQYSMRMAVLHSGNVEERSNQPRKLPSSFLFGPPLDGWIRPPRFVGGGISMATYDGVGGQTQCLPPWPYSDLSENATTNDALSVPPQYTGDDPNTVTLVSHNRWCTILRSDDANRDIQDYFAIQQTGDINALVMFIAHHPYVTEALLQLSNILYQTDRNSDGLLLLRRCLWIYESSSPASFTNRIFQGKAWFMDIDRKENVVLFQTIFRLVQISNIAGYVFAIRINEHVSLLLYDTLNAASILCCLTPVSIEQGWLLADFCYRLIHFETP
jgi:Transcriptional repressor TCF25